MAELDVILRLEYARDVLVGSILGMLLFFFFFLSLRFHLLLEGDKENMNLKVSIR